MQNQHRLYQFIREGKSFSGHERNCCFLNLGNGRYANISATSGLDFADDARGLALTDWDRDGDLDLWITNRSGPRLRYLQNNVGCGDQTLQFQLIGKQCPRDAIGARVTVALGERKLLKTLRAGDGYLAQSSKWLHFGLPAGEPVTAIQVQWPGGQRQEIGTLALGRRYLIEQGEPPREIDRLTPQSLVKSGQQVAKPQAESQMAVGRDGSESTRAYVAQLKSPIPVPSIPYVTKAELETALQPTTGKYTVVALWASWCAPCLRELSELAAAEETLAKANIDILTLSIDGVTDQATTRADAIAAQDRLELPFPSGFATSLTLDRLQQIHNQCFGLHTPLPLPTSFVFDDRRRLVAVLKGPADVQQLIGAIQPSPQANRGKWIVEPNYDLAFMVSMLLEHDALEDAMQYLDDFKDDIFRGQRYAMVMAQVGTRLGGRRTHRRSGRIFSSRARYPARQSRLAE